MVLVRPTSTGTALSPWRELTDMQNRIRQIFGSPFTMPMFTEPLGWMPAVDVTEADGQLVVTAELPGMRAEDVHIELADDLLTIRGEKKEETDRKDREMHVYERTFGSFQRSFTLPAAVDEANVKAEFRDGVLRISLPRMERARGKEIPIQNG